MNITRGSQIHFGKSVDKKLRISFSAQKFQTKNENNYT